MCKKIKAKKRERIKEKCVVSGLQGNFRVLAIPVKKNTAN